VLAQAVADRGGAGDSDEGVEDPEKICADDSRRHEDVRQAVDRYPTGVAVRMRPRVVLVHGFLRTTQQRGEVIHDDRHVRR
jgi:hypothetical protein